jgi:hypothetical protein
VRRGAAVCVASLALDVLSFAEAPHKGKGNESVACRIEALCRLDHERGGARAATVTITFLAPNQRCGNVASLFGEPFGRLPER